MSYSYVQRGGGVEQFHPFDYLGFRYLQIDNPGETLTPSDVVALARHTAVPDEHAGDVLVVEPHRRCDLRRSARTRRCTPRRSSSSTRRRARRARGSGTASTSRSPRWPAFGEQNLTRKSLMEFAQSQSRYWPNGAVNKIYPTGLGALDINEFTEIYPSGCGSTGCTRATGRCSQHVYPVLHEAVRLRRRTRSIPTTGLVTNLPSTSIYYDFPTVTRLNILGVNVFRRVGAIGAVLAAPAARDRRRRRERADALTSAINKRLTRPDGTYVDGLDKNGKQVARVVADDERVRGRLRRRTEGVVSRSSAPRSPRPA